MLWCLLSAAILAAGCSNGMSKRPALVAKGEPGLGDSTIVAVEPSPSRQVTFADRHPALSKPREMYETTQGNKLTKTAAGAFIGVPIGIGGEIKQIFEGRPTASTY